MKKLLIGIGACGLLSALILLAASPFGSAQAQAPVNGLLGQWRMDVIYSNNATPNTVPGSPSGIAIADPAQAWGKLGKSIFFDGVDGKQVKVGTSATLDGREAMTLSLWMYPQSTTTASGTIVSKGTGNPARFKLTTDLTKGNLRFWAGYESGWTSWRTPDGSFPLSKWQHIAVTYSFNASSTPTIYVNGVAQTLTPLGTPPSGPAAPDNGGFFIGSLGNQTQASKGKIDEVRFYDRVLSVNEIAEIRTFENPPNIVVVMTDDQDDASLADMAKVKSLLADHGVQFVNSFVNTSWCCPSRASFLTGQAAHNHGIKTNALPYGGYDKFFAEGQEANTLAQWLQERGYRTGLIGKYLNGYATTSPMASGWHSWIPSLALYWSAKIFENNSEWVTYGGESKPGDYQTDLLAGHAADFINSQQKGGMPFFLFVATNAPHDRQALPPNYPISAPVPAPRDANAFDTVAFPVKPNFNEADTSDKPSFWTLDPLTSTQISEIEYRWRRNREAIQSIDDLVETVVNTLQTKGILDNTVVVFTSDNGFIFGEHRQYRGKNTPYEESIRVPLVMRGPGIPTNETRDQLVNNLDLTASIVNWTGITAGHPSDGYSLASILTDAAAPWRTGFQFEGISIPGSGTPTDYYMGVRTENYKYIEHDRNGTIVPEFYDLAADPYELENKASDPAYTSVVGALDAMLEPLKTCVGTGCWVTTPEPSL